MVTVQEAEAAIYMSMYRLVKRGVVTDRREVSGDVKSRVRVYNPREFPESIPFRMPSDDNKRAHGT